MVALIFVLGTVAAPERIAAQNTWETFWAGMQTAMIRLETDPTQEYFDTLYSPEFTRSVPTFRGLQSQAAALTDMDVSFPIFIFENNRAAYQKVTTGIFTDPFISGSTNLPPTNAPVRFVTQGIIDVNGAGQITGNYSVTDGFANFQEWGALPLAPDQEYGQIGMETFDPALVDFYRDNADGFGLPFAVFPSFTYYNRELFEEAGLDEQPPTECNTVFADGDGSTVTWDFDNLTDIAKLLTIDANGNNATSPDFDPTNIVQCGIGLSFSRPPQLELNAQVDQGEWSAGYFSITTQPGTDLFMYSFGESISLPDPIHVPVFVFTHANLDEAIDALWINYDTLGILNQARKRPTELTLVEYLFNRAFEPVN